MCIPAIYAAHRRDVFFHLIEEVRLQFAGSDSIYLPRRENIPGFERLSLLASCLGWGLTLFTCGTERIVNHQFVRDDIHHHIR